MELWDFGRKIFSIIILDKTFNIIGETVFPEYTYNPNLMYIDEKDCIFLKIIIKIQIMMMIN